MQAFTAFATDVCENGCELEDVSLGGKVWTQCTEKMSHDVISLFCANAFACMYKDEVQQCV